MEHPLCSGDDPRPMIGHGRPRRAPKKDWASLEGLPLQLASRAVWSPDGADGADGAPLLSARALRCQEREAGRQESLVARQSCQVESMGEGSACLSQLANLQVVEASIGGD